MLLVKSSIRIPSDTNFPHMPVNRSPQLLKAGFDAIQSFLLNRHLRFHLDNPFQNRGGFVSPLLKDTNP